MNDELHENLNRARQPHGRNGYWLSHYAMVHMDRPCIGEQCDDEHYCVRHERTIRVVDRYARMLARRSGSP